MSARRSMTQPLPMELVGPLDSAEIQNYNKLLRLYRNRYSPLIRLSTTLLSWDNAKLRNNTNNNINNTNSEDAQYRQNPFCTPVPTLSVKRTIAVIDDQKQQNAEATLQHFLQYRLLSYILLHNLIPEDTTLLKNTAERLLIRHYAHESGKTNSFLIADLVLKKAILIDPHHGFISPDGNHRNVNNYCKDLDKFDLTLEYIFVTHAFLDLQLGVTDVLAAYQHQNKKDNVVKVVSGLSPNKEINAGHTETYTLGDFITVRTNAVPSFSRENIVVELYLSLPDSNAETLVALFAGTAWSVDSPPRGDVLDSYDAVLRLATQQAGDLPSVTELCQNDDLKFFASRGAMQTARENLYQFFVKRYGLDDQSHTNKHNSVVLFPSHGGYSNMSNQLDMYLGIYLSDLMKFAQCRKVIDCVVGDGNGGAAAYITYSRMMPPMPQWITYQTNRIANLRQLLNIQPVENNNKNKKLPPVLLDVRSAIDDYYACHLKNSTYISLSFPADGFGAKKAELWLPLLVLPTQDVLILTDEPNPTTHNNNKEIVLKRMEMAFGGSAGVIEVFTLSELLPTPPPLTKEFETTYDGKNSRIIPHGSTITWIGNNNNHQNGKVCFPRLKTTESLSELEIHDDDDNDNNHHNKIQNGKLILDVRTPSEFKSGSHIHSIHYELSHFCTESAAGTLAYHEKRENENNTGFSNKEITLLPSFATSLLKQICQESVLFNNNNNNNKQNSSKVLDIDSITEIIIYCAAGYRSLIVASILERALQAITDANRNSDHKKDYVSSIKIADVPGGAFQIMTNRPDLWYVKDRSIVCIS